MLGERAKWEDQSGQGEERNHKHQGRHGSFVSKYHSVLPGFLEPPLQVSSRKKHAYCELSLQMQTPSQSLVVLLKNQKVEWIVHLSNLHRHFRTSCQRLVLQAHPQEHLLPLVGNPLCIESRCATSNLMTQPDGTKKPRIGWGKGFAWGGKRGWRCYLIPHFSNLEAPAMQVR